MDQRRGAFLERQADSFRALTERIRLGRSDKVVAVKALNLMRPPAYGNPAILG